MAQNIKLHSIAVLRKTIKLNNKHIGDITDMISIGLNII